MVVVPLTCVGEVLKLAQAHVALEKDWIARLKGGETISEMFHILQPDMVVLRK